MRQEFKNIDHFSPGRLLLVIVVSTFFVETVVMYFLTFLVSFPDWIKSFLDSLSLVVLTFPALYFFSFRPLIRQIARREQAEAVLKKAFEELEIRIQDRTANLEKTNQALQLEIVERTRGEVEILSLSRFAEESPNPIIRFSKAEVLLYANPPGWTLLSQWQEEKGIPLPVDWQVWMAEAYAAQERQAHDWEFRGKVYALVLVPLESYLNLYAVDVTDQKLAKEALMAAKEEAERSLAQLRTVVDNMSEGLFVFDAQGKIVLSNQAMLALTGLEGVPKENYHQYANRMEVWDGQGQRVRSDDLPPARALRGEIVRDAEYFVRHLDSDKSYTALYNTGLVCNKTGQILMVVMTVRDITERKRVEQALLGSETKYRTLVENLPQKVFTKDCDSVYLSCNDSLGMDLGVSPDKIAGHTDYDFFPKEMADGYKADDQRIIKSGKTEVIDERYLQNGQETWIQTLKTPILEKDGTITGILGIFRDITENKQAEQALRESEERYHSLFEHMLGGYAYCRVLFEDGRPQDFVYLDVNKAFTTLTGLQQVVGKKVTEVIPGIKASNPELLEIYGRVALTGQPEKFEDYFESLKVWLAVSVYSTEPGTFVAVFDNISERKRAEEEILRHREHLEELVNERTAKLAESESNLRKYAEEISDLYNNAPCGYHSLGDDGTYLRINDSELSWLGYSCDEIVGKKKFSDLVTPESAILFQTQFSLFKQLGYSQNLQYDMVRKDGTLMPVSINTTAVRDADGRFLKTRSTLFDNFEQRQVEKALRESKEAAESANRAKSTFLANMSHEIRTPMNAILGFGQLMLRDSNLTSPQRQHLGTINRSGEHLLDLINEILEMSKIEAGRITYNPTTFDLYALIHDLEDMFRMRADAKNLQLKTDVGSNLPRYICADESKLRQIFINLLGNAVKFTDQGKVVWRVRVSSRKDGILLLVSDIEDTGRGIASGEMGNLFQAFGQTTSGIQVGGGTGLGLAISLKYARLMGGDLTVTSTPGKGSTFQVQVEVQSGQEQNAAPKLSMRPVVRLKNGQAPYRILVVDDQLENRVLATELLNAVGFVTMMATNGEEALLFFQDWKPHLILMDIRMSGMDGYEAIQRIKALPAGQSTPIIVVTASAFLDDQEKVRLIGADGYIRKPFKDQELFTTIGSSLQIEYEYAEENSSNLPAKEVGGIELIPESLEDLPADLINEIRQATLSANLDRLLELTDLVARQFPQLAERIREYANEYQYELILKLVHE